MSKDLYFEMRQQEVASLLTEVENGNQSSLRVYAEFKQLKDLFAEAESQIQEQAISEAQDYPDKIFGVDGFEFEKRNGSRRFSYKNIPEVINAELNVKSIKETYKQAFLSLEKGLTAVDENGEVLTIPTCTYGKDVLIVKKPIIKN